MKQSSTIISFFLGDAQLTKHLNLSKPVIYYADATFDLMCDYYFDMPSKSLRRQADANEKIGLNNSSIVIASSQWAVDSATSHYNQSHLRNAKFLNLVRIWMMRTL